MIRFLFTYIFLIASIHGLSQNFRLKHLSSVDGLSQNSVNDVFQDREGIIWIGTQDGLNRYDGYEFKYFRYQGDESAVHDNFITKIVEDDKGNLWLAHRKGVSVFSKTKNTGYLLKTVDSTFYQPVDWLAKIDGDIYLVDSNHNLFKSVWNNGRYYLEKIDLSVHDGKVISVRKFSEIWYLVTTEGLVISESIPESGEAISYPNSEEHYSSFNKELTMDVNGNLYFTTYRHLYIYNPEDSHIEEIELIEDPDIQLTDLCWSDSNELWAATNQGIYVIDGTLIKDHIPMDYSSNSKQNDGVVNCLFKDHHGQMWIGSANHGVSIYNPLADQFKFLNYNHGIEDPVVWSIYQDSSILLLGTNSGLEVFRTTIDHIGKRRFLSKELTYKGKISLIGTERIGTISKIDNEFWIGAGSQVFVLNQKLNELVRSYSIDQYKMDQGLESKASPTVTTIVSVNDRNFILTQKGVYYVNKEISSNLNHIKEMEKVHILDATVVEHNLWMATNTGIIRLNHKTLSHKKYVYNEFSNSGKGPSHKIITSITKDNNGGLWLGTAGGGINHFNIQTENFNYLTEFDGLANNNILGLELAGSILWISHNKGISSYELTRGRIKNYDVNDGVVFDEFAINSSFKNNKGQVWFGSANGVNFIPNYSWVQTDTFNSKVVLSGIEINYDYRDLFSLVNSSDNTLTLHPIDKVVSFRVNVVDYQNSGIKLEYQLLGFNSNWVEVESNGKITFTNLNPGDYTLKVRAINKHGVVSSNHAILKIHVSTPLWKRVWFILTTVVIIVGIIFLIIRGVVRRKYKKRIAKMEEEKRLLYEKQRISRDLHDNVGANLSYIVHSLDNYSYQLKKENNALSDELSDLGNETRSVMSSLRETIWAVKKESVSINEMENRIIDFSSKLLSSADIDLIVNFQTDGKITLSPFVALNLFRIIQEAVHNAVKHSKGSAFEISLKSSHGLEILLKDNGKGFDVEQQEENKFGLKSMKDRVSDIGGEFKLKSIKDSGTEIIIRIPLNAK